MGSQHCWLRRHKAVPVEMPIAYTHSVVQRSITRPDPAELLHRRVTGLINTRSEQRRTQAAVALHLGLLSALLRERGSGLRLDAIRHFLQT